MSKTLKWVLGVLAVLVVITVAAGAFFVWQNHMSLTANYRARVARPQTNGTPAPNAPTTPVAPGQKGPMMQYGFRNGNRQPMGGFGWQEGPMMGGRGFSHFGPFGIGFLLLGGLLRLIVPLGIMVIVALISYQMGKNAGAGASRYTTPPSSPEPTETPQRGRKVAKS